MKGSILRLLSKFDHYGTCYRCKISWKYREHMHPLKYSGGAEAFPLCQQCFDAVSPEQAAYHFEKNWESYHDFTDDKWVEAKKTFYLGAIAMKNPAFFISADSEGESKDNDNRLGRIVGWGSDRGSIEVVVTHPLGERSLWMPYGDAPGDVRMEEDESGTMYATLVPEDGDPE